MAERLGRVRANSATDLLLHRIAGAPVLTVESAAALIGRTYNPANEAVGRLVQAGIMHQITIGKTQPRLRGPGDHRRIHRSGAPARKSLRRHPHLPAGTARTTAASFDAGLAGYVNSSASVNASLAEFL